MAVLDITDITFQVMACNDAHIGLSTVPNKDAVLTYEIVIGAGSNTRSDIRKGRQGVLGDDLAVVVSFAIIELFFIT